MPDLTFDPPQPQEGDSELTIDHKTAVNISRLADTISSGGIKLTPIAVGIDFAFAAPSFGWYADATAGAITGQLPPATGTGQIFLAVKIDDTDNVLTVLPDGNDLIDGSISLNITDQWADCLLHDFSTGHWHAILGT